MGLPVGGGRWIAGLEINPKEEYSVEPFL